MSYRFFKAVINPDSENPQYYGRFVGKGKDTAPLIAAHSAAINLINLGRLDDDTNRIFGLRESTRGAADRTTIYRFVLEEKRPNPDFESNPLDVDRWIIRVRPFDPNPQPDPQPDLLENYVPTLNQIVRTNLDVIDTDLHLDI